MLLLEAPGLSSIFELRMLDFLPPEVDQVGGSVSPEHFDFKSLFVFIFMQL